MEIGSFISLDLSDSGEYFLSKKTIARLNSARAGIFHACRLYKCESIYIPYYLCPSVKKFLSENSINVKQYFINEKFEPLIFDQKKGHAFLLVNYFGILSVKRMKKLADQFSNVIIDNSAAFYCDPVEGYYNVYSPRKFFGVPDGCYVIGNRANRFTDQYGQDFSSATASFLLKRIEFSLQDTYEERMKNEERINKSGILRMSRLTRTLLNNIDYSNLKQKRIKNFSYADKLLKGINKINATTYIDEDSAPMVYPLVIENSELNNKLKNNHIYTGRWWNHVLSEVPDSTFEAWLSKYMIPAPIDHRYGKKEIKFIQQVLNND
jgi:hypothetical protein